MNSESYHIVACQESFRDSTGERGSHCRVGSTVRVTTVTLVRKRKEEI